LNSKEREAYEAQAEREKRDHELEEQESPEVRAAKRQAIEDTASLELAETLRKHEESYQQDLLEKEEQRVHDRQEFESEMETRGIVLRPDDPTPKYTGQSVWIATEKRFTKWGDEIEIAGVFSTLEDANNKARNLSEDNYIPRNESKEIVDENRLISYSWKDNPRHGFAASIQR
jgi:hypothetical protein